LWLLTVLPTAVRKKNTGLKIGLKS